MELDRQAQEVEARKVLDNNRVIDSYEKLAEYCDVYKNRTEDLNKVSLELSKGNTIMTDTIEDVNSAYSTTIEFTRDLAADQQQLTEDLTDSRDVLIAQREAYLTVANGAELYKDETDMEE